MHTLRSQWIRPSACTNLSPTRHSWYHRSPASVQHSLPGCTRVGGIVWTPVAPDTREALMRYYATLLRHAMLLRAKGEVALSPALPVELAELVPAPRPAHVSTSRYCSVCTSASQYHSSEPHRRGQAHRNSRIWSPSRVKPALCGTAIACGAVRCTCRHAGRAREAGGRRGDQSPRRGTLRKGERGTRKEGGEAYSWRRWWSSRVSCALMYLRARGERSGAREGGLRRGEEEWRRGGVEKGRREQERRTEGEGREGGQKGKERGRGRGRERKREGERGGRGLEDLDLVKALVEEILVAPSARSVPHT
eukprot:1619631-Rhodomonas_salina.1